MSEVPLYEPCMVSSSYSPSRYSIHSSRFRVQGSGALGFGFRVSSSGFRVLGFGFRVAGFGFRFLGFGFQVKCSGSRLQGLG